MSYNDNMAYQVLYRTYRPAKFSEVVGQDYIVKTLVNAIRNNKIAHAYLFAGPRGTGKTSVAKLFAKAINCQDFREEACDSCANCKAYLEGSHPDIIELDAASNNGVDDIREIIEQVPYAPLLGKYKVYIIDEVHMLSGSAFNAFLKTLEEPPAYAKFILATTEKHKILATILSRCQVYDFKRIGESDIVRHLQYVAGQEGVTAEEEALRVVASKADGALRDALSIFDQLVNFTGKNVTYKQTIESLNVLDIENYFKITDNLFSDDVAPALLLFDEILAKGFDAQHFIAGMASHFRDLLMAKDPGTVQLLDCSDTIKQQLQQQALRCDRSLMVRALELANQCDFNYKASNNKRLSVELCLMQINANYLFKKARQSQER